MVSHTTRHRLRLLGAAALATTATAAAAPGAAQASAYGYAYWGVHVFRDVPIPSGQLFGAVEGRGLTVNRAGGSFIAAGNLCNWHLDVDFYDARRALYRRVQGTNHARCSRIGAVKYDLRSYRARPGRACIRLYRDFGNERLASVCHGIVA